MPACNCNPPLQLRNEVLGTRSIVRSLSLRWTLVVCRRIADEVYLTVFNRALIIDSQASLVDTSIQSQLLRYFVTFLVQWRNLDAAWMLPLLIGVPGCFSSKMTHT
ncbi:predicted protein [Histoplasma capsulatum H143]|uniref:Uncharacterized protein n=1 Tax=Ajellomyces capsulatus (strain H143) TaxID=544712 RepID=C6HHG3_AJECH|nr:predicted protein [Histoplasma capsulatum H143]